MPNIVSVILVDDKLVLGSTEILIDILMVEIPRERPTSVFRPTYNERKDPHTKARVE